VDSDQLLIITADIGMLRLGCRQENIWIPLLATNWQDVEVLNKISTAH